jgi:ABC-type nitrate/sulfonate/bicarbonate transport system permease component
MQFWREIHLYLGCLFAPILIFFAVTGAWQLYRWNDSRKDGSYIAPRPLKILSAIHKDQHLGDKKYSAYTPLRSFMLLSAAGLVLTTALGIIMAFRFARSVITPLLCLGAGVVIPVVILVLYG